MDDHVDQLVDHMTAEEERDDLRDIPINLTKEPITTELAKIVSKILENPKKTEKFTQKLEKLSITDNLKAFRVKKYNPDIWSKMMNSKTRT